MISKIHLKRFKKFDDCEIYLEPFTVLMGENSSGKTTILQAINLGLISISTFKLVSQNSDGMSVVRKKGVGLSLLPGVNLADSKELFYGKIARGGSTAGAQGASIELFDEKTNCYKLQIQSLFGTYNIKCISEPTDLKESPVLHLAPPLFISGFVGLKPNEQRVFPVAILDRLQNGQVSEIVRNLVLEVKEKSPDQYDKLVRRLERDFDFYLEKIEFDKEHDLNLEARYLYTCNDKRLSLDFNASGSGYMQIIQILAPIYLLAKDGVKVVLLDEPDAHLHPNLQYTLAKSLREIQKELNIQIILSTHSTAIIRAASPSEVVPISANERISKPLSTGLSVEDEIKNRIDTYDLAKSVLSGKLVFIEDTNTDILEHFDKVLGTKCFYGPNTVAVVRGRGKNDKTPFRVFDVIQTLTAQEIEIHVIMDSDGLNSEWKEKLIGFGKKNNVKVHILNYHEIKNYLLYPSVIHKTLLKKYGSERLPTEEEIKTKIIEYGKRTISMNRYGFEDLLEEGIYQFALMIGENDYRNQQTVKSESKRIRESYEQLSSFEDLIKVIMGKETLKMLNVWLTENYSKNIGKNDLLLEIENNDIIEDIKLILDDLKSKKMNVIPTRLEEMDKDVEDDTDSIQFELL